MKVAVSAEGVDLAAQLDCRFGRARYFLVVDTDTGQCEAHDNTQNLNAAQGAGIQAGQLVARLGVDAVVSGNVGPKAFNVLREAGIKVFLAEGGTVGEAIEGLKSGSLQEVDQPSVPGHWM